MPSSTLRAAFEAAAGIVEALCLTQTENEETLTGSLLGSLSTAHALITALSPVGSHSEPNIYWGSYDKYQGADRKKTEPGSGADFALLTLLDDNTARLAIFQAKRGEFVSGSWRADLNRIPKDPERDPQIFVLAETAHRLFSVSRGKPVAPRAIEDATKLLELTDSGKIAGRLRSAFFVHYLIYQPSAPACITLPHLGSVYAQELDGRERVNAYALPGESRPFVDVMKSGVGDDTAGWLVMAPEAAIAELPNLLPLVPVIVTDSRGQFGPLVALDESLAAAFAPLTLALGNQDLSAVISAAKNGPGLGPSPDPASKPRNRNHGF
ncbi:hypothetical protein MWN52_13585 [Pseudoxanthomonas winnipegensis]|uniref:hypothetical protein n=1 Tax=Pseudoxanthomonas winnipegensis TaxID=2480810 RepID=UPI002578E988|nr:hypothetical protein [Pseudoxanthomonas winnipegensis]WJI14652.1 hypothetical protein MWN52_13585 [Pseudoxanthomonas winnipegensis]